MKGILASDPSLCHLTTDEAFLVLSGELFERLALRFGDQEGREDTRQHEQSEDLKAEQRRAGQPYAQTITKDEEAILTCA